MKKILLSFAIISMFNTFVNATIITITATSAGLSVNDTRITQGDTVVIRNINAGAKSSFTMVITLPNNNTKTVTVAAQGRDTTFTSQFGVYKYVIGNDAYVITYPKTTHTVNYSSTSGFSSSQTNANFMDDFVITNNGSNQTLYNMILPSTSIGSVSQYNNSVPLKLNLIGSYYISNGATGNFTLYQTFITVGVPIPTSVSTSIEDIKNLSIYPNPAKEVIYVDHSVEIYTSTGVYVLSGIGTINISDLVSGIYIVKSEKGISKLIKE
jgi:hypothetical protein